MSGRTRTSSDRHAWFVAMLVLTMSAGCALTPSASLSARERLRRELTAAEQRWLAMGVDSYRFRLTYACFCPFRDPLDVTVADGVVTAVKGVGGQPAPVEFVRFVPTTIEAAFGAVESNLDADEISVAFDPVTGIPTDVTVNEDLKMFDEEFSFQIANFQATE